MEVEEVIDLIDGVLRKSQGFRPRSDGFPPHPRPPDEMVMRDIVPSVVAALGQPTPEKAFTLVRLGLSTLLNQGVSPGWVVLQFFLSMGAVMSPEQRTLGFDEAGRRRV